MSLFLSSLLLFNTDTVILLKSPCINNLYVMAEESLSTVKNWLDNNSLEIKRENINYINFGIQKSIHYLDKYKIIFVSTVI